MIGLLLIKLGFNFDYNKTAVPEGKCSVFTNTEWYEEQPMDKKFNLNSVRGSAGPEDMNEIQCMFSSRFAQESYNVETFQYAKIYLPEFVCCAHVSLVFPRFVKYFGRPKPCFMFTMLHFYITI